MQPPWTLSKFVTESLQYQQGMNPFRFWSLVFVVWQDFDRMQRQDWREYRAGLREQMRERLAAV